MSKVTTEWTGGRKASRSRLYRIRMRGASFTFSMNPAPRQAPIILFLHGGPGDACIPATMEYNSPLEEDFRLVNLDQRGAGLSYHPFARDETVTIDSMLDDVLVFARRLLKAYGQDSLVVIGHSWGSVLGLEMVRRHPELVRQYIGLGQVVSMEKSLEVRNRYARNALPSWARPLVGQEGALADLVMLFHEGRSVGLARSLGSQLSYLRSPAYHTADLVHQVLGVIQSEQRLGAELGRVDFSRFTSFQVPVTFMEGRHDWHVPSIIVEEYAARLRSPHHLIWFEHSGHTPQWSEPGRFNALVREICLP